MSKNNQKVFLVASFHCNDSTEFDFKSIENGNAFDYFKTQSKCTWKVNRLTFDHFYNIECQTISFSPVTQPEKAKSYVIQESFISQQNIENDQ